jgi:hypothetical protein
MTVYQVNDFRYVREFNVLSDEDIVSILKDVLYELQNDPCINDSPLQTYTTLFKKYGHTKHWKNFAIKVHILTEKYYGKKIDFLKLKAWANLSNETNDYGFHRHDCDCTAVFYLHSNLPEYGTDIDNEFVIKATQNSMVIFDGKISHSVTNMPLELAKKHNRITIAVDMNISSKQELDRENCFFSIRK